jgi:hypothetical protein
MPSDPEYLREHARRCWRLAGQVSNPVLKKSLVRVAQRSVRLALALSPEDGPPALHFLSLQNR